MRQKTREETGWFKQDEGAFLPSEYTKIPAPAKDAAAGRIIRQLNLIPVSMSKAEPAIKQEKENDYKKQDLAIAVFASKKAHILTPHVDIRSSSYSRNTEMVTTDNQL